MLGANTVACDTENFPYVCLSQCLSGNPFFCRHARFRGIRVWSAINAMGGHQSSAGGCDRDLIISPHGFQQLASQRQFFFQLCAGRNNPDLESDQQAQCNPKFLGSGCQREYCRPAALRKFQLLAAIFRWNFHQHQLRDHVALRTIAYWSYDPVAEFQCATRQCGGSARRHL